MRILRHVAIAALLGLLSPLWAREADAQTFPADASPAWVALTRGGLVLKDSNVDVALSGGRNIVGASPVDQPSVLVASDASYLYFRMRVDQQPNSNNAVWACEIESDQDTTAYEYLVGFFQAASTSTQVQSWFNGGRAAPPIGVATTFLAGHAAATFHTTTLVSIGRATDWWQTWAIPRTDLARTGFVVLTTTPLRILCGTTSDNLPHLTTGATGDLAGDGGLSDPIVCDEFGCIPAVVGVQPSELGPKFALAPSSPNPIVSRARLSFELPFAEAVDLAIYDLLGRRVVTVSSGVFSAGPHSAEWDGRDGEAQRVAAGIYFVRLQTGAHRLQQKCVVLR